MVKIIAKEIMRILGIMPSESQEPLYSHSILKVLEFDPEFFNTMFSAVVELNSESYDAKFVGGKRTYTVKATYDDHGWSSTVKTDYFYWGGAGIIKEKDRAHCFFFRTHRVEDYHVPERARTLEGSLIAFGTVRNSTLEPVPVELTDIIDYKKVTEYVLSAIISQIGKKKEADPYDIMPLIQPGVLTIPELIAYGWIADSEGQVHLPLGLKQ